MLTVAPAGRRAPNALESAPARSGCRLTGGDDLTRIKGLGPKLAEQLAGSG